MKAATEVAAEEIAADGLGFSWCNETQYPVMAAIGIDEKGAVTTRGWYRVEAGKVVRGWRRGWCGHRGHFRSVAIQG